MGCNCGKRRLNGGTSVQAAAAAAAEKATKDNDHTLADSTRRQEPRPAGTK